MWVPWVVLGIIVVRASMMTVMVGFVGGLLMARLLVRGLLVIMRLVSCVSRLLNEVVVVGWLLATVEGRGT